MQLPLNRNSASLADWLELELLTTDRGAMSLSEVQARLAHEPDLTLPIASSQGEEDEHWSMITSDLWRELRHRARAARTGYPFVVGDEDVELTGHDWHGWKIYTFLAAVAARHTYQVTMPVNDTARLFEHVVACALASYLPGQARRVGWPVERGDPGFEARVRRLAEELMREPWGGLTGVSPDVKDHGLDVIAWRPFGDDRPGQPVVLCQCAIGTDFWEKKVDDAAWRMVIKFIVRPTPAIAFPVIPYVSEPWERSRWAGASISGGLMFDRLRIAAYATFERIESTAIAIEIDDWLENAVPRLPAAEPRVGGGRLSSRISRATRVAAPPEPD
jgi:hypothetical protein